ncbi:MAG TPA: hypothetical protein VGK67_01475 [Myxococcales bacterium]|jgi:hypothetical protein
MAEPLHVVELAAGASLQSLLRAEAAAGGRVLVALVATWAPPCKVLRQALADPSVAALLGGARVVLADIDRCTPELEGLGLKARGVPALSAWDPASGVVGTLSGNAWGQDTVENIAAALARWLPSLPAPATPVPAPAPPPTGGQRILAVVGVLVGLALLVAAAIWQVGSQEKQGREQADQQLRERIQKDVSDSVRKAMEKRAAEPPR